MASNDEIESLPIGSTDLGSSESSDDPLPGSEDDAVSDSPASGPKPPKAGTPSGSPSGLKPGLWVAIKAIKAKGECAPSSSNGKGKGSSNSNSNKCDLDKPFVVGTQLTNLSLGGDDLSMQLGKLKVKQGDVLHGFRMKLARTGHYYIGSYGEVVCPVEFRTYAGRVVKSDIERGPIQVLSDKPLKIRLELDSHTSLPPKVDRDGVCRMDLEIKAIYFE